MKIYIKLFYDCFVFPNAHVLYVKSTMNYVRHFANRERIHVYI